MSIVVKDDSGTTVSLPTSFYKYEGFKYIFTSSTGSVVSVSGSTLVTPCFSAASGTSITFLGPFSSIGSASGETFTVSSSDGYSVSYTLYILAGRFQGPTGITAYVGEFITINYTPGAPISLVFSTPTPPVGLSFVYTGSDAVLYGTPTSISPLTNYLFYGSGYGNTVSSLVVIQVLPARVSLTQSPIGTQVLTVDTPFDGVTLTNALTPQRSLSFSGTLPPGLTFSTTFGVSTKISGTPTTPLSGTFTASILASDTITGVFTNVTIQFTYTETVQFTYPLTPVTINLYSNIPISNTARIPNLYGSNLSLTAVTKYGTGSNIQFTSNSLLPTGLALNTVNAIGVISGKSTVIGTQICSFTATNSTPTSRVSCNVTFIVSKAAFSYTTPTVPTLYVGKTMTPISFSITIPAYLDGGASEIATTYTAPDGIIVTSNSTSFTLSGLPRISSTGSVNISLTDTLSNTDPTTVVIPVTVLADSYTFTAAPAPPYAFAQNLPITPIQMTALFTYGNPASIYLDLSLPPGLTITSSGLIQGTPTTASTGSTFQIQATNGYTVVSNDPYAYITAVDPLVCYSPQGTAFTLIPTTLLTIPIVTILRSGATVTSLTSGYLYGMTITPTSLSGYFGLGVYPDIVLPPGTSTVAILGSGASPPSTFLSITSSITQTSRRTPFSLGSNLYYTNSDTFATIPISASGSLPTSTLTDFQPAIVGSNAYMVANNTPNIYSTTDGGLTYSSVAAGGAVYQVTYADSEWYGLGAGGVYSGGVVVNTSQIPSPRSVDNGLVLRSVNVALNTFNVSGVISDGTMIEYILTTNVTGDTTGTWSFSGFTFPGYNLEQVTGTVSGGGYIVNVLSKLKGPDEFGVNSSRIAKQYSPANVRLLLGGQSLNYVNVPSISVTNTTNCSLSEVRDISSHIYEQIIAAGGYTTASAPNTAVSTLQYSSDYGVTWNTSTNDFTWYATSVVWGGYVNQFFGITRVWIALGRNITGDWGVKYSTNGITWIDVNIGVTITSVGPVQFDGTNWNLFANGSLYVHDSNPATLADPLWWSSRGSAIMSLYPKPWFVSSASPTATMNIGIIAGGPVFSSPTVISYLGYQYIPISTILFDTSDAGTSFFIASTLPPGLTWSPAVLDTNGHVCATITGRPVILGTSSVDVYAQNSTGISKITVTITTQPIPLKKPDTTPSGYTNFIKQKVIADSAVSAINNRALVSPVGNFLAIDPQPLIKLPEICCVTTKTIQ